MGLTTYPANYLDANTQQSKALVVVVKIEGLSYAFALNNLYTRVRYGDAGLVYGMTGLVYGALRKLSELEVQPTQMTLESGLTIQQRLEPEQGRASISSISLVFADAEGLLTQLCAPGVILDELLGGKEVKVGIGFQNTSYPDDFFWVFRGTVGGYRIQGPRVTLNLVDPNEKERQPVFTPGSSVLLSTINDTVTTIPLVSVGTFADQIAGPNGSYDPDVRTFIKIDDEWMEYIHGSIDQGANTIEVIRNSWPVGDVSTGAATHQVGAGVTGAIQLGAQVGGTNPLTLALKVQLSGWNGPWISGVVANALGTTLDIVHPAANCIALPPAIDAVEEYGLSVGDYVDVSNSAFSGNNIRYKIIGFQVDAGGRANRNLLVDQNLTSEFPTAAQLAFRSQFDVLPTVAGVRMKPTEIDVATFVTVRNSFFAGTENNMQFALDTEQMGKDFIEKELVLPLAAYSLTRYGRLSIGYTRPPIPADKLVTLSIDNIVEPENIVLERAVNTRRFYNYITYDYDYDAKQGVFVASEQFFDSASYALIKEKSLLPIESKGMRSPLGGGLLAQRRAAALLQRYANAAHEITLTVNWEAGSLVEVGDIILISDNGTLKIANLADGTRNLGQALYEVIDRTLNIKDDRVNLKLLGGVINTLTDRYGTITPSSVVTGGDAYNVRITSSFGQTFGVDEWKKWLDYQGLNIAIHSIDYSQYAEVALGAIDAGNPNVLPVTAALPFTPTAGMIVEVARYSTSTDPDDQAKAKLLGCYMAPSVLVAAYVGSQELTVAAGDVGKFFLGCIIVVHNDDYTDKSPEIVVDGISGNNVHFETALTFVPTTSYRIEFIGFADESGAYRYI